MFSKFSYFRTKLCPQRSFVSIGGALSKGHLWQISTKLSIIKRPPALNSSATQIYLCAREGFRDRYILVREGFRDIFGSGRGSEISLGQGGVQRYLWVSEGFRDIFGSVRGSEISLGQGGAQRYPWVREGFRDIFGSVRGSEISLGQ